MLMRSLEAHGVPSAVLDVWERTCGSELLSVQEQAVQAGVLAGRSLLVCSPTSSGKTLIGEMAAIQAALNGRKVAYLVPTRALAEAKYHELCARYAPLGLRVAVATRDRRAHEREIGRGEVDLIVAVPEKLRALLAERPMLAAAMGAVVADELQLLGDPERGPCLEMLLGDLVAESAKLQVVGLSAVLDRADAVAAWLGAELVHSRRRPVELRCGVLVGGEYHYVVSDATGGRGGAESVEYWPELSAQPQALGERMAQVAAYLAEREGATLVFVRDKRSTLRLAMALAERAGLPAAGQAIEELRRLEPTHATRLLIELAQAGVGFHSADLQFDEREVVEAAFARGELAALVCTSTLAVGVNLPARNVIVDVQRWRTAGPTGRPTLGPISRADFENMAGRAGRLGCDEMGRAILIADGEVQRHVLQASYLGGGPTRLDPPLRRLSPLAQVCLLAGSIAAGRNEGLAEAWRRTLSAHQQGMPQGMMPSEIREALDLAGAEGLVEETAEGAWRPTAVGRLCGASGLTPASFLALMRAVRAARRRPPTELEALLVAALTDEAQAVPLPPPGWGSALVDEFATPDAPCDDRWEIENLLETAAQVAPDSASAARRERAVRIVLAMQRWRSAQPTAEVERAAQAPAGRLAALAEAVGWALRVLARIGHELGWTRAEWTSLLRLGESVAAGVPEEGMELHRLHVPGLGRGGIRALLGAGINSRATLARADAARLEELLGPALAARALAVACGVPIDPRDPPGPALEARAVSFEASPRAPAERELLVIDSRRPDRVLLADEAVKLRPAEFRLLQVLASSPRCCVDYEAIYERMWGDESFVEPAQIYSHRSRLAKKLGEACPGGEELVRTIPKRGLMLDLPPERVSVR